MSRGAVPVGEARQSLRKVDMEKITALLLWR